MATQPDIFVAECPDVRPIANVLRSLSFRTSAVVHLRESGIKIIVEEGRSVQASAYLQSGLFSSYSYTHILPTPSDRQSAPSSDDDEDPEDLPPTSILQISLSTLLECLNIFGNAGPLTVSGGGKEYSGSGGSGSGGGGRFARDDGAGWKNKGTTSLTMSYAGEGEPLVLKLTEDGMITRCELTTYVPDAQMMGLQFDDDSRVEKLIMKSEYLHDAFLEIDPSSTTITMSFTPPEDVNTPYNRFQERGRRGEDQAQSDKGGEVFRLESVGTLGSTEMDYPNDRDVLEVFECEQPCKNSYKFSHINLTSRALAASTKTSIRTSEEGLISFQFMIPFSRAKGAVQGDGRDAFVEFLCLPLATPNE